MRGEKIDDRHSRRLYGWLTSDALATSTGTVRPAAGAVSEKQPSDDQFRRPKNIDTESIRKF